MTPRRGCSSFAAIWTRSWRACPENILACARAYVAGINARIDEVLADRALLPLEYGILGVAPLKWDLRDLVLARGGGFGSVDDEVRRARLAGMGLLDLDAVIAPLRPAWTLRVPEGLDAAAVSEADLGRASPRRAAVRLARPGRGPILLVGGRHRPLQCRQQCLDDRPAPQRDRTADPRQRSASRHRRLRPAPCRPSERARGWT